MEQVRKISQKKAMELYNVSRTWLFKLRKEHGLKTYTFPDSNKIFYAIDEIEALLQPNENDL